MTGSVTFTDESKEHSVRRKAEYDDKNLHDLVLTLDKRGGGQMTIPLLKNARSNIEWEDHQENTLLRVKPLAELTSTLPVSTGYGAPVYQGKGVALLRPGYLYVFRGDALWRELEVDTAGQVSDVDLASVRASTPSASSTRRHAEGEWLSDILVPVFLQGSAVMHETRMAYSEVQWDWNYIQRLESDSSSRDARTTGIGHAWATTTVDSLNFESGFPASRIADVNGLRVRDLGIELMLESPTDFLPGFEYLAETELYVKLSNRIRQNQEDSDDPVDLELTCDSSEDVLARFREQKGLVCVALPDPLFQLRHSLAQLHLALHYLDAVDVSIQHNPMAHSAMLIRQAVFDPASDGSASALSSYANAIDRKKLDEVLDAAEKDHAVRIIDDHVAKVSALMKGSMLTATLDDYRECSDLAICEAYLLISDALDVLQQIPGVLKAQGIASKNRILSVLKAWVTDEAFLIAWAPEEDGESGPLDTTEHSPFNKLAQLARNQTEIDDGLLERLNLQSLVYLEKQINEKESGNDILKEVAGAGRISSLVSGSLGRWSTAILTVCKRLIEEGAIQKIEIQRVMQAAASNFVLSDPDLKGIEVMDRAGAVAKGSILGVSGGGIHRGLTDFDRSDGVLTRAKDYLCADFLDDSNEAMASTSPVRAADALEETIHKSAGGAVVFFSPKGHPEVEKLSLAKVDFAKRVGKVVDGPAVSRGLVVLAAFNVFVELNHLNDAYQQGTESFTLAASKVVGGAADLFAASLKLSTVLGEGAGKNAGGYALASRPLFDMKGWTFIGSRLSALRAATLVRTVGLASFLAGGIGVGLSFWEMRISLANKDFDAATGHAIAMTGGLVFLASPMMATLLAIPGWGWAVLGMSMAVGGGLYADSVTDDSFEQLLKRGPWGTSPNNLLTGQEDKVYYSQLLSLLSPIQVSAQKYADIEPDSALSHSEHQVEPDDYVITVTFPLVSRMKLFGEQQPDLPAKPFRLSVQELAYKSSTTNITAPSSGAPVTSTQLLKATPLAKVIARQSLPHQSAVRFLVKREFQDSEYQSQLYQETVTTRVRVGLQATLDTELGPLVFPAPVYKDYEPFDVAKHSNPPAKDRTLISPYDQPVSPYWFFTEVST